jgi:hypothetical protein
MVLTLYAFYPYVRGILTGSIRPHVFSWIIWGITTGLVFLAQLSAHGGAGAWAIGVSACITMCIAELAWQRRADIALTGSDWLFLIMALVAIPLWQLTHDAMWSVCLLTVTDLLGFGPTVRKAWRHPRDESVQFYGLFLSRNIVVILALQSYSVTTVLFPAATAMACAAVMGVILGRRKFAATTMRQPTGVACRPRDVQ